MRTGFILALLTASALAAPVPKPAKPTTDFERFQGVWDIPSAGDGATPFTLSVTDKAALWQEEGQEPNTRATLVLDETTPLKRIDFTFEGGNKALGIYRFDCERITIAFTYDSRPTSFDKAESVTVFTMTRAKAKK